jgi:hypothetical protein
MLGGGQMVVLIIWAEGPVTGIFLLVLWQGSLGAGTGLGVGI